MLGKGRRSEIKMEEKERVSDGIDFFGKIEEGQLTCPFIPLCLLGRSPACTFVTLALKSVRTPIDYFYRGKVFILLRGTMKSVLYTA